MGTSPLRITRSDLKTWAEKRETQAKFPLLIRKLISASASAGVSSISMPAEEGVSTSGADGVVIFNGNSPWIPTGKSVWELSVSKDPKRKATDDYGKRSPNTYRSDGDQPLTYVAVSLRPWKNKREWAKKRQQDGNWDEVRAFDIDDIVAWVDATSCVTAWLAAEMGKPSGEATSASQWWKEWVSTTRPELTPALLLAGRQELCKQLILERTVPANPPIACTSEEEARAIIAACALHSGEGRRPDDPDKSVSDRVIFVFSKSAWDYFAQSQGHLWLVPFFEEAHRQVLEAPNHTVITPAIGVWNNALHIPAIGSEAIFNELRELPGLSPQEVCRIAHIAEKGVVPLHRALQADCFKNVPSYLQADRIFLVTSLLMREWKADDKDDLAAFKDISGLPHSVETLAITIDERFRGQAHLDDPLVGLFGERYQVIDSARAWNLLGSEIEPELLKRYKNTITTMCTSLSAEATNQGLVGIVRNGPGGELEYPEAPTCLRSMPHVLWNMKRFGANIPSEEGKTADAIAEEITSCVLAKMFSHPQSVLTKQLIAKFPILAEVNPSSFLSQLEGSIAENTEFFRMLVSPAPDYTNLIGQMLEALQDISRYDFGLKRSCRFLLATLQHDELIKPKKFVDAICKIATQRPHAKQSSVKDRWQVIKQLADRYPQAVDQVALELTARDLRPYGIAITRYGTPRYFFINRECPSHDDIEYIRMDALELCLERSKSIPDLIPLILKKTRYMNEASSAEVFARLNDDPEFSRRALSLVPNLHTILEELLQNEIQLNGLEGDTPSIQALRMLEEKFRPCESVSGLQDEPSQHEALAYEGVAGSTLAVPPGSNLVQYKPAELFEMVDEAISQDDLDHAVAMLHSALLTGELRTASELEDSVIPALQSIADLAAGNRKLSQESIRRIKRAIDLLEKRIPRGSSKALCELEWSLLALVSECSGFQSLVVQRLRDPNLFMDTLTLLSENTNPPATENDNVKDRRPVERYRAAKLTSRWKRLGPPFISLATICEPQSWFNEVSKRLEEHHLTKNHFKIDTRDLGRILIATNHADLFNDSESSLANFIDKQEDELMESGIKDWLTNAYISYRQTDGGYGIQPLSTKEYDRIANRLSLNYPRAWQIIKFAESEAARINRLPENELFVVLGP